MPFVPVLHATARCLCGIRNRSFSLGQVKVRKTGRKTLDTITITDRKPDRLPFSSKWPPIVFRALAAIRFSCVLMEILWSAATLRSTLYVCRHALIASTRMTIPYCTA